MTREYGSKITFLGDVFLPREFGCRVLFENLIFNLEYPITQYNGGIPDKVNLKVEKNFIGGTFEKQPLAVCLSNNHIMDYGDEGYKDTVNELDLCGIKYFGAGNEKNNFRNPLVLKLESEAIALLGYTCSSTSPVTPGPTKYGVQLVKEEAIKNDIVDARAKGCETIIVSLHWGAEQVSSPKPEDIALARKLVDYGADMIIGHHSHCIQSYEIYKDRYIFYGLGNCIIPDLVTDAMFDPKTNKPGRQFTVNQKYWNKTSLAVTYDSRTKKVEINTLLFDGKILRKKPFWYPGRAHKLKEGKDYVKKFRRLYLYGKLRNAIFNWLVSPKFPRIKHIKSLMAVFNPGVYK